MPDTSGKSRPSSRRVVTKPAVWVPRIPPPSNTRATSSTVVGRVEFAVTAKQRMPGRAGVRGQEQRDGIVWQPLRQ